MATATDFVRSLVALSGFAEAPPPARTTAGWVLAIGTAAVGWLWWMKRPSAAARMVLPTAATVAASIGDLPTTPSARASSPGTATTSADVSVHRLGPLSAVRVAPGAGAGSEGRPCVVLAHGMYHGAWHWRGVQLVLAARGVVSYALVLPAGRTVTLADVRSPVVAALVALGAEGCSGVVLAGHSQGGLIVQDVAHAAYGDAPAGVLPERTRLPVLRGVALVGTGMLGDKALVAATGTSVRQAVVAHAGWMAYLRMALTLSLGNNLTAMKSLFMLPTTTTTTVTGTPLSDREYFALQQRMPADGWITYVDHVAVWGKSSQPVPRAFVSGREQQRHDGIPAGAGASGSPATPVPVLVVQFEHDVCYLTAHAQRLLQHYSGGKELGGEASYLLVKGQAHCFAEPGWEDSFAKPFAKWIDTHTTPL